MTPPFTSLARVMVSANRLLLAPRCKEPALDPEAFTPIPKEIAEAVMLLVLAR